MPSAQARFLDSTTPPHVATLVAQSAIAALAMNVFLPSLPSMATYFQTDYAVVQLSVSLYLAVNAGFSSVHRRAVGTATAAARSCWWRCGFS